ncbi:MAG: transcriptional repressor [Rubellimicrobium sp.]|nr:transcriptional repressor [Rubellimicrobium sp.]
MTQQHAGAGRKLTRNQTLVLGALHSGGGPASAYDLLDRLRDEGMRNPLQIYRALNALVGQGLVHRLESLNAFVACAHPHEHGEGGEGHDHGLIAFAICGACRSVEEFSDPEITRRLADWAAAHAFRPDHTILEMRGTCAACRG